MKNTRTFLSVMLVLSWACAFAAKDFYVSEDKSYGADLVPPERLFDDLQAAIDAADPGDTVLVDDGFVCKTGENAPDKNDQAGATNRILITKAIVVRSKSGCVDEAQKKGATIVGAYSSDPTKMGKDSIRPAFVKSGTLVGFILENGSVEAVSSGGGGGVSLHSDAMISNCVIRGCFARGAGGVYCRAATTKVVSCVISNNVASAFAGGVSGGTLDKCHVIGNSSGNYGGGVISCTILNSVVCGNRAGTTTSSYGGGGHNCTYASNTVFCCNTAPKQYGGGVNGGVLVNCVVSNNVAGYYGGGCCNTVATNCLIIGNSTTGANFPAGGGGAAGGTYYNCTNVANTSYYGGGGFFGYRAGVTTHAIKCIIKDNKASSYGGGGAYGYNINDMFLEDCFVTNNLASVGDGGGVGKCYVTGGEICGNTAGKSGGGAATDAIVSNCVIYANSALDSGGGASGCTLVGCSVTNNVVNRIGGGAYNCTAYNCRFVGNVQTNTVKNTSATGGAYEGHYYNCLFLNNRASSEQGTGGVGAYNVVSEFINCTITGNEAGPGGAAGATCSREGYMKLVNVICAGNTGTGSQWCSRNGDATDCCLENAKPEDGGTRIVREDPRLTPDENGNLVPKNRKCKNSGAVFDWMSDPNDVRSKDLAGRDRIQGSAPDFGCFESKIYGMLLMVR